MIVTEWQARHGLSASDYQHQFDLLGSQGYRLVKVSGYCENNQARYAGIWYKRGGNGWQARHGISASAYQQAITELELQNFRPTHLSVFTIADQEFFSAIWEEQNGLPWIARYGLTSAEYQQLFNELSSQGWRLRCVSGYEFRGEALYACIWDRYAGSGWAARHGLDAASYQQAFDELGGQGFRLFQVTGYSVQGIPRFAAIWEQSPGHGGKARHGIPAANYQNEFNDAIAQGFRLADVSGYPVGNSAEFTTIWENAAADNPNADAVSALVIPFMQKWAIPGLSLAVARSGSLITTRNFGYANPITSEVVTSSTRFRIASISKPITAATIFRLIEQNQLALTDKIFGVGARLGTRYGTLPYGANIENITLQHLLEHASGGWPNDGNDPMFQQPSLSADDLISWTLNNQPLLDTPGRAFRYSNFGFCVLGRVIEAVTGQTYADAVRNLILSPSGVTQMSIAGNTADERQYPEAIYYGVDLQAPYKLPVRRMDAHGGWIATPSDLLQFLMRVDGFANPADILQAGTVTAMTTPSGLNTPSGENPNYARGWNVNAVGTRWHNGVLSGTSSIMVRTANQHEWAAVCNIGNPDNKQIVLDLDALMWQVDGVV
jgi:CubicO group peptidase (beta-lactamase class C family)